MDPGGTAGAIPPEKKRLGQPGESRPRRGHPQPEIIILGPSGLPVATHLFHD